MSTQVMPETPRWLVQKGRLDEARRVLARLGSRDGTLEEIQAAVAREADQQGAGWGAVFKPKTRGVRRAILVGVGVGAAQQMLAEEALLFYLPRILLDLGETRNRVYAALVGMGVFSRLYALSSPRSTWTSPGGGPCCSDPYWLGWACRLLVITASRRWRGAPKI